MHFSPRPHVAPCEQPRSRKRADHRPQGAAADFRPPASAAKIAFRHAPRWAWRRARGAFTLIELVVVILIMAILASIVVMKLEGPAHQARMKDVAGRMAAMDFTVRSLAQTRDRPLRLVIDLSEGRLRATDAANDDDLLGPCTLPSAFAIGAVRTQKGEQITGTVDIPISRLGLTPTYALRLEGPGGRKQWILVAGLSGERAEINETELRAIFEPQEAGRHAG